MSETQDRVLHGTWTFDGHGLNRNGQRIMTMSKPDPDQPGMSQLELDLIARKLVDFCNESGLGVDRFPRGGGGPSHPPRISLTLDEDQLSSGSGFNTIFSLTIRGKKGRRKGKVGSVKLSVIMPDTRPPRVVLGTPSSTKDHERMSMIHFVKETEDGSPE